MSVYFDNIVLTETPEQYNFTVECDVGVSEERRWTLTARPEDVGVWPMRITVLDPEGNSLGTTETTLRVVPADAGQDGALSLLVVGDSVTEATWYINEVASHLSAAGNPTWTMLGTKHPAHASPGVYHEGRSGWTWTRFAEHYDPNPDSAMPTSPFVYLGQNGQPALDILRYLDESCDGARPTMAFFLLGINDGFSANPDDPAAIDAAIDTMVEKAEKLLRAFHEAVPEAHLGFGLTPPPNSREAAFLDDYGGRYHRWGWKRIQHRMVEREIEHFGGREAERIYIVPTELGIDPVEGYPQDNAVHPNLVGHQQLGAALYSWMKSLL